MMSEYIDRLKIKLVTAVDLKKGKINKKTDMYEALKELENFPMTLDILNSSRIGRIVNDIRHFDDTDPDIKSRLKHLIKQWNDKLLPNRNKKPNKPSNSNGCSKGVKVSDSSNIFHYNNENHKEKHLHSIQKIHKSSNNLEIINGIKIESEDCDNSFEVPNKKIRLDNTNKKLYSDSPKNLLREIHLDSDSCPPTYKSNNLISQHKHDSPAVLHFPDVKTFIKREEEHNSSPLVSKDKQRKRKHNTSTNGVTATPLQKVKSTRELLVAMGDVVPSDTKKRILCNEIAVEDDLPKSCVPEAVRPKSKIIKPSKTVPESLTKNVLKSSPMLLPNVDDEFTDYSHITQVKVESFEPPVKLERNASYSSFKENKINIIKSSPFTQQNNSPFKTQLKSSPMSDVQAQSIIATPTLCDDIDKSLKWKLKKPPKKKSKHPDLPITNRMDDLPTLPDLAGFQPDFSSYYYNANDLASIELTDNIVELLAHLQWEGYNCTRQPISKELLGFSEHYTVDHLHILAWTDTVNECPSFFPVDTEGELAWLESVIGEYS